MKSDIKLNEDMVQRFCCPICKSKMKVEDARFLCTSVECNANFPIIDGIPVLINESNSLFCISDFTDNHETFLASRSKLELLAVKLLPSLSRNLKAQANFLQFRDLILKENANLRVLVVGGTIVGSGLQELLEHPSIEFVESDVAFGPRTNLICDAHDIPFADATFDGVVIQAVLEHVVDPYRCVEEIHRVLKKKGIVYAETAFMQQLHGSKYDFTRFTHLGHRRLFNKFTEICSGAEGGPSMALAWSYKAFLLSFFSSKLARAAVNVFVRVTAWWLKYIDNYLIDKACSFDSGLEYYFMGTKNTETISDREIVNGYRGEFN